MRRILASLLLVLFGFSLIAPATFASNADAKLPACCRRDGKHHCSMTASRAELPSGPAAQAAKCASFPSATALPASQVAAAPGVVRALFTGFVAHSVPGARTESLSRISYSQAGQKRGPPAFAS